MTFFTHSKKFFLNGSEYRLRPGVLQYGAMPSQRLAQGFNFGEIWPENRARRGTRDEDWKLVEDAERAGMPISGNALFMADFVGRENWEKPAVREDFRRQMELQIRRVRNSPAIVMWGTSGNALGIAIGDSDPWTIGLPPEYVQEQVDQRRRARQAIDMVKEVDPTRIVFGHHSDNGDMMTSNMCLNFIPLQEREEWLSHEFGPPLYSSMMRGRDGYTHQGHSEPFMSEWGAVYFGTQAYRMEPEKYRAEVIRDRFRAGNLQQEYEPHIRTNGRDKILDAPGTSFHSLLDLFYTNTWRSWRTMGVTGGMVPWHHDQHPALKKVNGPSLAWIAGPGSNPDQDPKTTREWTSKDHSFKAGQTIEKQIVLINDHRAPQVYSTQIEVMIGGKKTFSQTKSGSLQVAEIAFLPIKFNAPATVAGDKVGGQIKLSARIGPDTHEDSFAIRVFAPPLGAAPWRQKYFDGLRSHRRHFGFLEIVGLRRQAVGQRRAFPDFAIGRGCDWAQSTFEQAKASRRAAAVR